MSTLLVDVHVVLLRDASLYQLFLINILLEKPCYGNAIQLHPKGWFASRKLADFWLAILISAFFYKQENKILYGRFKILNRLPDFTNKQYTDIFEVNRHASRVWINDKRMKGYIKISKTKGRKNYYILSDKAKDLLTFFDKRKLELQEF